MTPPQSKDDALIGAVFAAPNRLRYPVTAVGSAILAGDPVPVAAPGIIAFLKGNRDWPLLLPRCAVGDEGVTWYACAHSEAHLRGLQAEMHAFIGPTFSYFPSVRTVLDRTDDIERAIDMRFEGRVLKIDVPKRYVEKVNKQIERYIGLLMRRPTIATHAVASFNQLRARFDMALLAGNESAAQECLNALIARNLSAENRHFLNIRFYAALGQWNRIAEYPLLPALISLKLPPETYSDIFEALYQTLLHSAEEGKDLDTLLKRFDERLFQAYPVLFRTRRNSNRPAVLKGAICRELTLAAPDPQQCLALLSQLPAGAFPTSIEEQIRARCQTLQAPDPSTAAFEALKAEEFDRSFDLFIGLPPTLDVLCALLRCAREIGEAAARTVVALLDAAPEALRAEAAQRSPKMYKIVTELASSVSVAPVSGKPLSLTARLRWLRDEGETAEEYVARLREGAASWDITELLSEINCGPKSAEIIETLSIEAPEVFEQAFPLWYRLFIERLPVPDTRLVPVYLALMATMRIRATYGDDELTLIKRAAACVLECGVNAATYKVMVDDLGAVLDETRSIYSLDWAIDLADQLLIAACPASEARMRFLASCVSLANQFARRLTSLQGKLVQHIASESGLEFNLVAAENMADEEAPTTAITGRVAIYTLDSATAGRARDMLMESYPGLRVDLNHDQVCTSGLRNLAKQVDWFAFAWRCATHQAWFCVKDTLGDTGKLCWAKGNGAASLAQAIEQRLLAPPDADKMVE
jgi:hypothetical protein